MSEKLNNRVTNITYNPANDTEKLLEILSGEVVYEGEFPARWLRCMAAEILDLRSQLADISRKMEDLEL